MSTIGTTEPNDGWRLLDIVSFIGGAGTAMIHLRPRILGLSSSDVASYAILAAVFLLLSVTASGPFVFLTRKFILRTEGYPGPADLCWPAQGLPWLFLALVKSNDGYPWIKRFEEVLDPWFLFGLIPVSAYALLTVWRRWTESQAAPGEGPRRRLGTTGVVSLALASTWPLQIALWLLLGD